MLPNDVVIRILMFLPIGQVFQQCTLVSKFWKAAVRRIPRHPPSGSGWILYKRTLYRQDAAGRSLLRLPHLSWPDLLARNSYTVEQNTNCLVLRGHPGTMPLLFWKDISFRWESTPLLWKFVVQSSSPTYVVLFRPTEKAIIYQNVPNGIPCDGCPHIVRLGTDNFYGQQDLDQYLISLAWGEHLASINAWLLETGDWKHPVGPLMIKGGIKCRLQDFCSTNETDVLPFRCSIGAEYPIPTK